MAPHDWILQFTYQFNGTSPAPSDHFSCLASTVKCASLKFFSILKNHAPYAFFIIKIRSICMTLISIISHRGSLFWQQLSQRIHGSDLLFHTYRADGYTLYRDVKTSIITSPVTNSSWSINDCPHFHEIQHIGLFGARRPASSRLGNVHDLYSSSLSGSGKPDTWYFRSMSDTGPD